MPDEALLQLNNLKNTYKPFSGSISSDSELNSRLILILSLLLRGTKKKLLNCEGIRATLDNLEHSIKIVDFKEPTAYIDLLENLTREFEKIKLKEFENWPLANQKTSLAVKQVDLSGEQLFRFIPWDRFIDLLHSSNKNGENTSYIKALNENFEALKEFGYDTNEITKIFFHNATNFFRDPSIPVAESFEEESHIMKLRGPKAVNGRYIWDNINFPVSNHPNFPPTGIGQSGLN
jgi:hypothetical protein